MVARGSKTPVGAERRKGCGGHPAVCPLRAFQARTRAQSGLDPASARARSGRPVPRPIGLDRGLGGDAADTHCRSTRGASRKTQWTHTDILAPRTQALWHWKHVNNNATDKVSVRYSGNEE